MGNKKTQDYYTSISKTMMREFVAMYKSARIALLDHYTDTEIDVLQKKSRDEYVKLFASLPYIGGKKNSETINIIMGAIVVAIVRPLLDGGLSERQIGKVIYDSFVGYFRSKPQFIRAILGKLITTDFSVKRMKRQIERSSRAVHEDNFHLENIEQQSEGSFDFGYNYTQCALCRIFADNSVEDYLKYVCLGDYALFRSIGVGFSRTQTIAHGAPICDFRFRRKGTTPEAWPPEQLPEWIEA